MDPFANRSNKAFAAQFEPDGDSFLFRADHVAAPVRITAGERDEAINAFRDAFYGWRRVVISVVFAVAFVVASHLPQDVSGKVMLIAVLGLVVAQSLIVEGAYRTPARRFADRAPEAPALSKEEARIAKDRQITWTAIGMMGFFGPLFTYWLATSQIRTETWLTLFIGPVFLALAPYGIWRKFRSA